jgi:hypothetical protein
VASPEGLDLILYGQMAEHGEFFCTHKTDTFREKNQALPRIFKSGGGGSKFGSPLIPGTANAKDTLTPATADEDDVFTTGGVSTNRDTSDVFQPESFEDLADACP